MLRTLQVLPGQSLWLFLMRSTSSLITPYHCQANGLAEIFNRYIRTALRCHSDSENLFEHLGLAMLGIKASYNHDIQMSRAERLFGKNFTTAFIVFY